MLFVTIISYCLGFCIFILEVVLSFRSLFSNSYFLWLSLGLVRMLIYLIWDSRVVVSYMVLIVNFLSIAGTRFINGCLCKTLRLSFFRFVFFVFLSSSDCSCSFTCLLYLFLSKLDVFLTVII